jgi:GAF domain-containing protein
MTSFLGVPIMVGDDPVGNLYLTDKADGAENTEKDETALTILAEFAGVAIDHAQRYGGLDADRAELQQTVDTLNAALQISHTVCGTNIEAALQLIDVRSRPLRWRRAMVVEQDREGEKGLLVVLSD